MKILIPTFNRPQTHLTAKTLFESGVTDWYYVVHNTEQLDLYTRHWPKDIPCNILVSDVPLENGLGGQRRWCEDQIPVGDWYVQMDDNVEQFTQVHEAYYEWPRIDKDLFDRGELNDIYSTPITARDFMESIIPELQAKCVEHNTCFGGFAITENCFFRGKKWTRIGFVVGKVMLFQRNDKARFDPTFFTSDDYQYTAEALLHFGSVARNNYVYPRFPRYMSGGLGRLPERQRPYARAAQQLLEKYPGAFNINYGRKDMDPGSAIKFRFTDRSEKSLERWRAELLSKGI